MTCDPQTERFHIPLPLANLAAVAAPERVAVVGGPVPREQVDAPISPRPTPLDTDLFQDPKEVGKSYWLPRYHLGEERVSGQDRYRIAFSNLDDVWRLTIRLDARPAPGMDDPAARFPMLEHELDVLLSYSVLGASTSRKTLRFQEVLRDQTGAEATLVFTGLPQRDEVFTVLGDPARAPTLTVARKIRVAIQQKAETAQTGGARTEAGASPRLTGLTATAARPPLTLTARDPRISPLITGVVRPPVVVGPIIRPPAAALPAPKLRYLGAKRVTIRGVKFERHELGVENWKDYHASLFAASPNLPPCGQNKNASRTWLDILDGSSGKRLYGYCAFGKPQNLQNFSISLKEGAPRPKSLRIRLTDRQVKRKVDSNAVLLRAAPPPPPQFITVSADMEQQVEPVPFAFSKDLHGYIFTGVGQQGGDPGGASTGGLLRRTETFNGAPHSYFQDAAERNVFFHLPDDFRIARRGGGFRPPLMTLRVRSNGGSTENTDVTWDYAITPWTNPARLASARDKLAAETGLATEAIEFQPLVTSAVTFTIQRPTKTGRVAEERPSSSLMLEGPVIDTLAIPVVDFQLAFDAMLGRTASVLSGQVAVDVEGWGIETRPFVADFTTLAGPLLNVAARLDEGLGVLSVDLVNAVESPVLLDDLALSAARSGDSVALDLSGLIAPGAALQPGELLTISMPQPDLPGAGAMEVVVTRNAAPQPDDALILDAILDRATLEYYRDITVEALPMAFDPPAGRPNDQIFKILVDFEGGDSIDLEAGKTVAAARIDYPFEDVLTRKAVHDGTYRYTRTVIRVDGRMETDPEPQSADADRLFLNTMP